MREGSGTPWVWGDDDVTRLTPGHAGQVMAALNTLVIGLPRVAGHTKLAAAHCPRPPRTTDLNMRKPC